ncbi:MAG: adenosine deaminase [Acidobacteria bacterium]|nr:adenosine deaminase [Acidobacteriota bacterium]
MSRATREELQQMPKLELHLHLEGSMTQQQLLRFSRKYQTPLAEQPPDAVARLYAFQNFTDFLNTYKLCCQHLKTPEDYQQLTGELLQYLEEQNCVYAEVLFTPSICARYGLPAEEVIDAVLERAGVRSRTRVRWIFDTVRQWGPDPCWQTLEWAIHHRDRGVAAICIGGDETSQPARAFREVFEEAEKAGLHRVVHAGEIGDARSVWLAIEELRAERIAHGIHSLDDPLLLDYLARHRLPLDICITSNFKTGAADPARPHPLGEISRRGFPITNSSDDPGLFQSSLLQEWERAAELLEWSCGQFADFTHRSLGHAFLAETERGEISSLLTPATDLK